jgi:hypothetical protein
MTTYNPPSTLFTGIGDFFGIPVIPSESCPKNRVMIGDFGEWVGKALIISIPSEIELIVRRGVHAAFPDFVDPADPLGVWTHSE